MKPHVGFLVFLNQKEYKWNKETIRGENCRSVGKGGQGQTALGNLIPIQFGFPRWVFLNICPVDKKPGSVLLQVFGKLAGRLAAVA